MGKVGLDKTPEDIALDLSDLVDCEIVHQEWKRVIYATDASPYKIVPKCVVLPQTRDDVVRTVKYAFENLIPVIARGGGSGVTGAALGRGIIIDFSRHMNKLLEQKEEYVKCEPGVYKKVLDESLGKSGAFLPPDPSSSGYCTIGGMIANNAAGAHSLKYGTTIDYLLSAELVLFDGSVIELAPVEVGSETWSRILNESTIRAKIYDRLFHLVSSNKDLLKDSMPKVTKNSAGYRLDRVLDEGTKIFNPAKVLCASEGTLGIILSATFLLRKQPKEKVLLIQRYDSFEAAGDSIPLILSSNPSTAELIDKRIIEAASSMYPQISNLTKGSFATLVIEFDGNDEAEFMPRLELLRSQLMKYGESEVVTGTKAMAAVWKVREQALGFAYKAREAGRRTETLIEDPVVPPKSVGRFLNDLYQTYDAFGLKGAAFGHFGDGNIHARPLLDYKSQAGLDQANNLAKEVYSTVKRYGGSTTGEHSDGLIRAPYLESVYNRQTIALFREIKQLFDPHNIMNPGKKVDAMQNPSLQNLRGSTKLGQGIDVDDTLQKHGIGNNMLNWGLNSGPVLRNITGKAQELSFQAEIESCFGCGLCREKSYVTRMCPVYKGLGDEIDSCRGRNNLLRWTNKLEDLSSNFSSSEEYGEAIYKHCIECKMCVIDCTVNTNVGKLMAEARARYAKVMGVPKGYKYFFQIDKYAELGGRLAPASNWLMKNSLFRRIMEQITGIDRDRQFPPFHRRTFADQFKRHESHQGKINENERSIAFFYDTYLNYNNPELGIRIVRLFEENGIKVIVPPQTSSGLPAILEGAPDVGREIAKSNIANLIPHVRRGIPIVTFSPSAGIALKSDYLDVYDTPESRDVSANTYDIHEYLSILNQQGVLRRDKMKPVDRNCLVHMHCHTRVQKVDNDVVRVLSLIPSLKFDVLERGCCGIGGSYSFMKGNLHASLRMGTALFDSIRTSSVPVYSTGESCALQMTQGSGTHVGLTSELLAEAFSV